MQVHVYFLHYYGTIFFALLWNYIFCIIMEQYFFALLWNNIFCIIMELYFLHYYGTIFFALLWNYIFCIIMELYFFIMHALSVSVHQTRTCAMDV